MNETFKQAVVDFFDPYQLVELLEVPIEDIVELLEDVILENEDLVKDMMNYNLDMNEVDESLNEDF